MSAVLVQKSAGLLSNLVSTNQFYEVVNENLLFPCSQVKLPLSLVSTIDVPFTPTKAGNFQGVLLQLYCASVVPANAVLRVRLQENTGAWVDRLTFTAPMSNWIPDTDHPRFNGIIDCRFSSTYPITTASNTWRISLDLVSGDAVFEVFIASLPFAFSCPYIDSTVTLTSSDTLFLTDRIEVDQDLTFSSKDISYGFQLGKDTSSWWWSVWSCSPRLDLGNETTPQIYVPSTVAGDYTTTFNGSFFVSSYSTNYLAGEDSDNPIPLGRIHTIQFIGNTNARRHQFLNESVGSPISPGKMGGVELYGEVPNPITARFSETALEAQPVIKVVGDVTSVWSIGDHIMIGGAQFSATQINQDAIYNEYKEIQNLSFVAGVTTITCTTNLTKNYYYDSDLPGVVGLVERPVVLTNDTPVASWRPRHYLTGGFWKFKGVQLKDVYWIECEEINTEDFSAVQLAANATMFDGCTFENSYGAWTDNNDAYFIISNSVVASDEATLFPPALLTAYRTRNLQINGNYLIGRMYTGLRINYVQNGEIYNNHFNARVGIEIFNSVGVHLYGNEFYRESCALYLRTLNDGLFEDNLFRYITGSSTIAPDYDSGPLGCYFYAKDYVSTGNKSYRDDADDSFSYVFQGQNSYVKHIFYDVALGTAWLDDVVHEAGASRNDWFHGTEVVFHNMGELAGHCKHYKARGYVESCGEGLPDTTAHTTGPGKKSWRLWPYFIDWQTSLTWKVPVGVANEEVEISIWVKLNSTNYAAGVYDPPKFRIYGVGVSGASTEAEASVATTDWQQIEVSGTPTETGDLYLECSIKTDAVGSDGYVYWDDVLVGYQSPMNFGGLDEISNGIFIIPTITAAQLIERLYKPQITGYGRSLKPVPYSAEEE